MPAQFRAGRWSRSIGKLKGCPRTDSGDRSPHIRFQKKLSLLEFTWVADWEEGSPPTVVRFDLKENNGVTTVRLTHSGFTSEPSREQYQGWPWLLALLQKH